MKSWLLGLCLAVAALPMIKCQITIEGCGTTKGCYRSPEGCSGPATCGYFLSWSVDADGNNAFEMAGEATSYIAVGFSKSGRMVDSDVYACTSNNEVVRSRNTEANTNDPSQPMKGVSNVAVSVVDNRIECTFTRQAMLADNDETYYDLSGDNTYTIIMSKSSQMLAADGNIEYHFGGRVMGQRSSFTSVDPLPMPPPQGGECGTTKGCFQRPSSCSGPADCDFFLSWEASRGGSRVFQIAGSADTFVAVGFSKSGRMSNSDVYACTSNNEVVRSRNTVANINNADQPLKGVSDVAVTVADGRIDCTFTRQDALNDNDDTYYDLRGDNKYAIIMSKSSSGSLQPDGNIMYHLGGREIGSEVSFNDLAVAGSVVDIGFLLRKIHGCLMIIAWVGLASLGITMARYFKQMSPGKKPCGTAAWFMVHRMFMVLAFLLTIAAFVIIFVAVGGFLNLDQGMGVDTGFIHAILGTVVTFLAIVNPIMAIFRPHPGTPRRPIFNWAHWGVGTSAHILAMVTIMFAFASVGKVSPILRNLPHFLFYIMIGFIAVHIIMWIILECRSRRNTGANNDIPMKGTDSSQDLTDTSQQKSASVPNWWFAIYLVLIIIFTAVFEVFIALTSP